MTGGTGDAAGPSGHDAGRLGRPGPAVATLGGLLVVLALVAVLLAGRDGDDEGGPVGDGFTGTGGGPAMVLGSAPMLAVPEAVAADADGVWTANTQAGSTSRIDPVTLEVTDSVPTGSSPVAIAVGEGAVWVVSLDDSRLWRIDPDRREVTGSVEVGEGPISVAAGEGAVWVASGREPVLTRVDPATLEVTDEVELRLWPQGIAVGDGAVWVSFPGIVADDAAVWRIDAESLDVTARTPVVGHPRSLAAAPGAVWVATDDSNVLTRLDPRTGDVIDELRGRTNPFVVTASPDGLDVWVLYGQFEILAKLDPVTGAELGFVQPARGPVDLAAPGDGSVWIANVVGTGPSGGRVTLVGPAPPS